MESGDEVTVQPGVISKVAQPEMSQMHHTSIQNSGADAKINQNLAETLDLRRSGPRDQQSAASPNGETKVAVWVTEFNRNEGIGKLLFGATRFSLGDILKGFRMLQIVVPICAIEEGFARWILNNNAHIVRVRDSLSRLQGKPFTQLTQIIHA